MGRRSGIKHICVLKTGKLYEHDMAANALKEQGLPFLKQLETLGGIKLAMPFQPSMGPGTFYTILVSEIISDKEKQAWKIFAWILLFGAAIFLVVIVARYFNL